jgi:hypothetical protein
MRSNVKHPDFAGKSGMLEIWIVKAVPWTGTQAQGLIISRDASCHLSLSALQVLGTYNKLKTPLQSTTKMNSFRLLASGGHLLDCQFIVASIQRILNDIISSPSPVGLFDLIPITNSTSKDK